MIAFISGKIAHREPTRVTVQCGPVGLSLRVSLATFERFKLNEAYTVWTYLEVKEDALNLYGFAEPEERAMFELLTSVSGVGGAVAMTLLSSATPAELRQALVARDEPRLRRIKGVGPKLAGRLVLELADKVGAAMPAAAGTVAVSPAREEALAALVSLGFKRQEAETRIEQLLKTQGADATVETLIKLALKN